MIKTSRLSLITLLVFLGVFPLQAESPQPGTDFGAETVEDTEVVSSLAVPVELVEEKEREPRETSSPTPSTPSETTPTGTAPEGKTAQPKAPADAPLGDIGSFNIENENGELDEETTRLLNASELDIEVLIKAISRLTRRNYIVDNAVKGKVTIHLPKRVTLAETLRIFDSVLHLRGFTTVPIGENLYKIIPGKEAQKTTIPLLLEPPKEPSDVLVTELLRLKHVQAEEIQKLLAQFVSKDGLVNIVSGTNAIIIIDSAANIERLRQLVLLIDVPASDQDITIIPILHAEAKDIADKVNEILGEKNKDAASQTPRINSRAVTQPIAGRTQAGFTTQPTSFMSNQMQGVARQALPLKIIPDERTNSIIVVADPLLTAKVKALVEQLDSELDQSGGRFYVYSLKHADAEELADILNSAITGSGSKDSSATGRREREEENTATQGSSLTRSSRESSERQSSASDRLSRAFGARSFFSFAGTGQGEGKVNFEGEVSIAADPATNSLIINAARSDYLKVKELIDKLDVKRQQVLVEATILEVSLDKSDRIGISLQASGGNDSGGVIGQSAFASSFLDILGGTSASAAGGIRDITLAAASSGTITLPGDIVIPSQGAILKAISVLSNVNVLSAPTILTTDNVEAEIIVGQNLPFVTNKSTDTSNINNTFNQIERQDVGIKLRITPQIGTGDFVTLKIFVEISDVIPGTVTNENGPSTTIRSSDTTVEVKSNQMIVTGGLIADNVNDTEEGLPYIKDIPVLGNLFKGTTENRRRTNLLIFITPRILADHFDAREETITRRDVLSNTIEEQQSVPDRSDILHRDSIDNVVEEAPHGETLPTPITVPPSNKVAAKEQAERERANARMRALIEKNSTAGGGNEDVIDLNVKPKLPDEIGPLKETISRKTDSAEGKLIYVVLRPMNAGDETLGLTMLGTLSSPNAKFFRAGERYHYEKSKKNVEYVCLGVYGTLSEVIVVHPELKSQQAWVNLPLKEVVSLGKSGWQKSNTNEKYSSIKSDLRK